MPLDNAIALKNLLRERLEDMLTTDGFQDVAIIDSDDFISFRFSFIDVENYNKFVHFVLTNTDIDFSSENNPFQKSFNIKIFENTTVTTDVLRTLLDSMQQPLPTMYRTIAFRVIRQPPVHVITPPTSQELDYTTGNVANH